MVTLKDIKHGLSYSDIAEKEVIIGGLRERNQTVCAIEYYFDIIDTAVAYPRDTWFAKLNDRAVNLGDRFLPYKIENINEGVQLCREFCAEFNIPFTGEQEETLRLNKRNSNGLFLIIFERPIYIG